jgi:hypothetical protein
MQPVVSVIVTSDYASGKPETWNELRAALAGLARQDFQEPAEFLLIESADLAPEIPTDLKNILPALQVIVAPAESASKLKNEGVRVASADLVAMIDGDCVADSNWLSRFVALMRSRPEIAAVSGRTVYGGGRFFDRVMALISRSFLDTGRTAPTRHLTVNNAGFRRSVLLSHPFPEQLGPHMSVLQAEPILRAGGRLFFEPGLRVLHHYDGWSTETEIRRSMGYGVIRARHIDRRLPHAWMAQLGYFSIPLYVASRVLHTWWNCLRGARRYGVAWYQLPAAFGLAAAACAMEIPGMILAVRGEPLDKTEFR